MIIKDQWVRNNSKKRVKPVFECPLSLNSLPETQYYFCKDTMCSERPTFVITPKEYFDREGFLYDSSSFDPKVPGFEKVSDSTFEYIGSSSDPEEILLKDGNFMWRDMLSEIKYTYRRRRLLRIESMKDTTRIEE